MARDDPQLKLRLPPALKEWVEAQANRSGRSVNTELVWMIEFMRDRSVNQMAARDNGSAVQQNGTAEPASAALDALLKAKAEEAAWRQLSGLFARLLITVDESIFEIFFNTPQSKENLGYLEGMSESISSFEMDDDMKIIEEFGGTKLRLNESRLNFIKNVKSVFGDNLDTFFADARNAGGLKELK